MDAGNFSLGVLVLDEHKILEVLDLRFPFSAVSTSSFSSRDRLRSAAIRSVTNMVPRFKPVI